MPPEILFLLSEEDNHITRYRAKVEKDKLKVEKDFDMIKRELINLMDDLKV